MNISLQSSLLVILLIPHLVIGACTTATAQCPKGDANGNVSGNYSGCMNSCDFTNFNNIQPNTSFKGAHLSGAKFDLMELTNVDFSNTVLDGASFNSCQISNCIFSGSLDKTIFTFSTISNCTFDGTLDGIRLDNTTLDTVHIKGKSQHMDLAGATINNSLIIDGQHTSCTADALDASDAKATVTITAQSIDDSSFANAKFQQLNFAPPAGSTISAHRCSFNNATINNLSLTSLDARGGSFDGTVFTHAPTDYKSNFFFGAHFNGTDLSTWGEKNWMIVGADISKAVNCAPLKAFARAAEEGLKQVLSINNQIDTLSAQLTTAQTEATGLEDKYNSLKTAATRLGTFCANYKGCTNDTGLGFCPAWCQPVLEYNKAEQKVAQNKMQQTQLQTQLNTITDQLGSDYKQVLAPYGAYVTATGG